jgi:nicotinate-nucleotide--dimethylbenzimidazole phosphoribosyltransferase
MISDPAALEVRVRSRLDQLTKPRGSLGLLEDIAVRFALIRGEVMPSAARKAVYIFCGDHGVTDEGVSAFPQMVTQQMMRNFVDGGAAISALTRQLGARSTIVDTGACGPPVPGVLDRKIAPGTRNFTREPAMTRAQAQAAIAIGEELAAAAALDMDLVGLGEMGIGNTTTAAAILSAATGRAPDQTVGAGTGVGPDVIARKAEVVRRALALHRPDPADGIGILASVGGFEMGAIAGFLIGASTRRLPVVLDGFPCCAGALIARAIKPDALKTAFFSHRGNEHGHPAMLEALGARGVFDFGMRLGEGTGAAIMMSIIEMSVLLYREMATFREAVVDQSKADHAREGPLV